MTTTPSSQITSAITRQAWADSPVETAYWTKKPPAVRAELVSEDDLKKLGWMKPGQEYTFHDEVVRATDTLRATGDFKTAALIEKMFDEIVRQGVALNPEPEPHPWGVDP